MPREIRMLTTWPARRWAAATLGAVATVLVIALPTAMIDNPVFGRAVPVTWWAWPVLLVAGLASGLLLATYVRGAVEVDGTGSRTGVAGAFLTFFAVGCPVCNKAVLIVLGTSGALQWFAPVQPVLALAALVLLLWALRVRLLGEAACPVEVPRASTGSLR